MFECTQKNHIIYFNNGLSPRESVSSEKKMCYYFLSHPLCHAKEELFSWLSLVGRARGHPGVALISCIIHDRSRFYLIISNTGRTSYYSLYRLVSI